MSNWLWYGIVVVSGFVLPRVISTYQGQALLGIWDFGWTLVVYVELMTLGVIGAVSRFVSRQRTRAEWTALNNTVNSSLAFLSVSACLGIALAVVFTRFVPSMLGGESADDILTAQWLVLLLSITTALHGPANVLNGVITGYERFDLLNLIRSGRDVARLVLMLIVLASGGGLVALGWTTLLCDLASHIAKYYVARRLCPTLTFARRHCRWDTAREMIQFGGRSVAQGLARSCLYGLNSLIVGVVLGPAVLAIYARQRALVTHMMKFVKQYAQVIIPTSSALHAAERHDDLVRLVIASARFGMYITLPIAAILIILGGPLLELWMGPEYRAPAVLTIMVVGHMFSVPQMALYSVLMGMGRHGWPALFEMVAAILSIVVTVVALYVYGAGMLGAAVGMAVPVAISGGVLLPWYACRNLRIPIGEYIAGIVPKPVSLALPGAAAMLAVRLWLPVDVLWVAGIGVVVTVIITGMLYALFVLPEIRRPRPAPSSTLPPAEGAPV